MEETMSGVGRHIKVDMFLRLEYVCDFFFFFFSSRRRHTRSLCDWSSDVCSSDLTCQSKLQAKKG